MPQQKPVVKCSICGYLCEGREAGRHRELTKHNCWELIMNQKNDFQASEYTSRRGIPQNKGIEHSGYVIGLTKQPTNLKQGQF